MLKRNTIHSVPLPLCALNIYSFCYCFETKSAANWHFPPRFLLCEAFLSCSLLQNFFFFLEPEITATFDYVKNLGEHFLKETVALKPLGLVSCYSINY